MSPYVLQGKRTSSSLGLLPFYTYDHPCFHTYGEFSPPFPSPLFWAAAPKGQCPVEHRGNFHTSVHPSVLPSPPVGHQGLKFALPALNLALQASNQPSRLQISPPRLKSDLQTSDLPSRPSTRPPSIKSALCGSNLPSKPQIHSQSLNSALQPSNMPSLA